MEESAFSFPLLKKSFPFLIAAGTGVSWKMLDDFQDKFKYSNDSLSVEFAKVAVIFFTTLYILQDVWIGLVFCILVISCLFIESIDNNFWKSASFIPFLLTFYKANYQSFGTSNDILVNSIILIGIFIAVIFEAKMFPEEDSTRKKVSRILILIGLCILVWFLQSWPSLHLIQYFSVSGISYFFVSILNTTLFQLPLNIIHIKENIESFELSNSLHAVEVK